VPPPFFPYTFGEDDAAVAICSLADAWPKRRLNSKCTIAKTSISGLYQSGNIKTKTLSHLGSVFWAMQFGV